MPNSKETIKFLVGSYVVAMLYTEEFKKDIKDLSEEALESYINILTNGIYADVEQYFKKGGNNAVLYGNFGQIYLWKTPIEDPFNPTLTIYLQDYIKESVNYEKG